MDKEKILLNMICDLAIFIYGNDKQRLKHFFENNCIIFNENELEYEFKEEDIKTQIENDIYRYGKD